MDGGNPLPISHIGLYWRVWSGTVAVALILRFTFFPIGEKHTGLVLSYMFGAWLPIMVLNVIEGRRLMSYLQKYHHEKWAELTHAPFGPGGQNGFRTLPWLLSGDDQGDLTLAELKKNHRRFLTLVLTVFFTMPVMTILLSL